MAGASEAFFVTRIKTLVEGNQHGGTLLGTEFFALDRSGQKGVSKDSPSDHPALHRGKLFLQAVEGGGVGDVTVVDQLMTAQLQTMAETIRVGWSFVELLAQTGMDDDLFQRVVIKPGQKCCQLILVVQAQARLDGELYGQLRQNLVEEGGNGIGIGQQAGTPPFTGDHGGRATQIPVDVRVPQIVQSLSQREEAVYLSMEKLRYHRQALILVRLKIAKLLRVEG